MMFSSHIDMICKNSAFLDIFVKKNKGTWDLIKEGYWNWIPGSVLARIALYALKHDMAV